MSAALSAFDSTASLYDAGFSRTLLGRRMRAAVWKRCAVRFAAGSRVLEMNCGTGEDALWLANRGVEVLATDLSAAMLRVAEEKCGASAGSARIRFRNLSWEDLAGFQAGPFDGALSNFGGLNCVEDLRSAAQSLATKLRPGAVALLCIMGPAVPWEWIWFLAKGDWNRAFRRLHRGGTYWSGTRIYYPSVRRTQQAFTPEFRLLRVAALGALLPPPYTERIVGKAPRLVAALDRIERHLEAHWPLPQLADHYLMELERV